MPGSKKARPYASKAQQRKLHVLAEEGKISQSEVRAKDQATKRKPGGFKKLPARKKSVKRG